MWRPLFFEFATDSNTYAIDEQFMVGPALMVSPVLTEGATTVTAYHLCCDSRIEGLLLRAPVIYIL